MKNFVLFNALRMLGVPRWMTRLAMLIILASSFSHLWAGTLAGRVVGVSDGDTITVLDGARQQHRIRLQGIDAPESKQAFGNVAKRGLSDLVFGQTVEVRFDKEDRYGRILGVVFLGGQDMNLAMVSRGLAWHYKSYQRDQAPLDRQRYALAEDQARQAGIGLWRDPQPTPPWDFRRQGD
jgi:endonuclease YncB( thermonuclease family)